MPWLTLYVAPAGNEITEPLGTPATNELSWEPTSVDPLASIEDGTDTVRDVDGAPNGRLGSAGGGGAVVVEAVAPLKRPTWPYRYGPPYSDLTLLPLMALMRYQNLPERVVPPQVTLAEAPVTLVATVTRVFVATMAFDLAVADGDVCKRALQAAYFVTGIGLKRPDAAYR